MIKKPYSDMEGLKSRFNELYGDTTSEQYERYVNNFEWFKKSFDRNCSHVASSSGRVEVCGNHTDHNGGKVVSCAISLDMLAMFLSTEDNIIHIKSQGYDDIIVDLNAPSSEKIGTSAALVRGVSVGLSNMGYKTGGFCACCTSNVVGGAGISSSASFEVLIAEILNFLYNDNKISCEEKAIVAKFAENEYFGKPCGLLDQTAISFGGLKKLDFCDKNKIFVEDISCKLNNYTFVLINTGGSHADLTDEYAAVPMEMFQVANAYGKERLVDLSEEEFYSGLPRYYNKLSDRAINRAIHFYQENKRVDNLADALKNNDYATFLRCVRESGVSSLCKLQNCYVSGSKDQSIPKALFYLDKYLNGGANRVHGGGFAGSILNVVENNNLQLFLKVANECFGKKNVIPLKVRTIGTIVL